MSSRGSNEEFWEGFAWGVEAEGFAWPLAPFFSDDSQVGLVCGDRGSIVVSFHCNITSKFHVGCKFKQLTPKISLVEYHILGILRIVEDTQSQPRKLDKHTLRNILPVYQNETFSAFFLIWFMDRIRQQIH